MSSVPGRGEIAEEYKWDLESIYGSDEEWEAAFADAEDRIEELSAYEGRVTESGATLLAALETYEELMRQVETVSAYARMRRDEDTRRGEYQAMASRAGSLVADAESAASFIEPELQALDREDVDALVEAEPALKEYEHYFDDVLRKKAHTRSAEVEDLLADLSEVTGAPGEIYGMLSNADVEFPTVEAPDGEPVEITNANFTTLLKRPARAFRREVYEAYFDTWGGFRNTVASAYENAVTADVKLARARDYGTAREAALDGPNVPVEVYDALLETVRANLGTLHRHAELKREALGVDELRMWDLYVPLAAGEGPTVEYEAAREHVIEALGALGEDYRRRVAEGLDSRWVDVYENEGKRSGAYSGGTYDTQPYILMNYQDDVSSMYTLAHELGHSLHSQLASEHQPYVYSDYDIFVAEVASTVNEALLTHHLLDAVTEESFRRHVLNEYLERFRSTLYRQTMFADFELGTHRVVEDGGALTPDRLDERYRELKAAFYEPAVLDDRIAREWMRVPHFYSGYYVFQYATGLSSAVAIARRIRDEGEPAVEDYLDALKMGGSKYPIEVLKHAGVDVTNSTYIKDAITEYRETLDEMESLMD